MYVCMYVSMISHIAGEEQVPDVVTAYLLSQDIPFHFNTDYLQYLPNVPVSELHTAMWAWLAPLVEKIKKDLIALGRWDRQCYHDYQCMLWDHECVGALTGRAARTHLRARVGMLGRFSCVAACLGAQSWSMKPAQQHKVGQRSSS